MGQIVIRNQEPVYCNLQAIQTGGSLASTVPALGEVWMIDSTNASKVNGSGKYDKYIVGDGSTAAKDLIVREIDLIALTNSEIDTIWTNSMA